ncbi:MAG: hypothetical protein M3011_11880 [Actinomycetota bacterium]|nr:hypothetical protein [Actinomycetota bacterium]
MGLFDSAKDSFKGAVGNVAEGSVDSVRGAVADVLQDQLEDLLGKAMVKMIASVNEQLQEFAALNLATKADIARLEASIGVALATGSGASAATGALGGSPSKPPARRKALASSGPPTAVRATGRSRAPAARRPASRGA